MDYDAWRAFVKWHIAEGTGGLVPCGTTGESPTLDAAEKEKLITLCVEEAAGRVPVIAGTGSNCTRSSIEASRRAEAAGADAVMLMAPYYNKPNQAGLYEHFKAVAEAVSVPVVLYNVPSRTITDIAVDTIARLSEIPNIVAVKDATANLARVSLQKAACRPGFIQLSGEDPTAVAFNAQGGVGCISVTANVAPRLCADLQAACAAGDYAAAQELHDRLMPLHTALFSDVSPAPLKYALSAMGKMENELRLPLVPTSADVRARVDAAMKSAGVTGG